MLVIVFTLATFVACTEGVTTGTTDGAGTSDTTTPVTNENQDRLPKDLNFNNDTVNIFYGVYDPNFDNKQLEMEGDSSGNTISRAVYLRNISVEERLKVKL